MDRCESGSLPGDVRDLLLIKNPKAQHDDPEQGEEDQRGDEREFRQRLTAMQPSPTPGTHQ